MERTIENLTQTAFAPYGTVIEQPDRAADAGGPGWTWWGENALLPTGRSPYGIGYLDLQPADPSFDWAERHMLTSELIIPLDGACLVYVAPAEYPTEPDRLPPLEAFRVFRVKAGQAALLDAGVWHGAPLAEDRPLKVMVLLGQGTGKDDIHLVRFPETPVRIRA